MKSRKRKNIWTWILAIFLIIAIPLAFVGKSVANTFRSIVGRNKTFIDAVVVDNYQGRSIDDRLGDLAKGQVHNVFRDVEKKKGKFLALGVPDTIPSFVDLVAEGKELSYNLPVQFEKGFVTFVFRVKNKDDDQQVIWLDYSDGIAPHDDFKSRLRNKLP